MSRLLIQFSHLYKAFGTRTLFEDISLSINEGEIFALIGENGAGKTKLLQLLVGTLAPDSGSFSQAPHLTIGFLPQEIMADPAMSVRAYLEEGELPELEKQMAACLEDPNRLAEWAAFHEKYEQLGGYRRIPIEKVLRGLKLEKCSLDFPMAYLSSGQKVRVALAKALSQNPDLLLLDEPTNYLDAEMLEWLQKTLQTRKGATVIVSHDRKFLNETCNRLIEIKKGKLTWYGGNYDFYLAERKRFIERQIKAYEVQEEERSFLKQKIKAIAFSKSKPAPMQDRNIMAYDRRGGDHQRSDQRKLDALKERLAEIEANPIHHPKPKSVKGLKFAPQFLASSVAIELNQIKKVYGSRQIFSDLTKKLCKGDRVVLTGSNGAGKTTLLRCIAGLLSIDEGQIRMAPTVKIGYLDQEVELLPMDKTPLEYFERRFQMSEEDLRREMHKCALEGDELIRRPFSTLSIGQRKRLMLLALILEQPNVLILDEPTNHLDFLTLEAFEEALLQFEGVVLAASHDPVFIEKIGTQEWRL